MLSTPRLNLWIMGALLAALLLGVIIPVALAQSDTPPHRFGGSVTLNGSPAPDGTRVGALIDGSLVAATSVRGGNYRLDIIQPAGRSFSGKTVAFQAGDLAAAETVVWQQGGATVLNLTAFRKDDDNPPHRFGGLVTLDGSPAPSGTRVTALVEGVAVASTTTIGGNYQLDVAQPDDASFAGKRVMFQVGGQSAAQAATWQLGGATMLNLTASRPQNAPATPTPIAGPGSLVGFVFREGQSAHAGTTVRLHTGAETVTAADGSFVFRNLQAGNYTVTASALYHLPASYPRISLMAGETVTLPWVILRAGDLNQDGMIDEADLWLVQGNQGTTRSDW